MIGVRLQDEKKVYDLICAVQKYLETCEGENRDGNLCRIYIRRIEHLYYKVSTKIVAQSLNLKMWCLIFENDVCTMSQVDRESFGKEVKLSDDDSRDSNTAQLLTRLTTFIYHYPGTDLGRIRTRAMLCHIYYHALHNRWFQARDLMLMSHLQEASQTFDIVDQVI